MIRNVSKVVKCKKKKGLTRLGLDPRTFCVYSNPTFRDLLAGVEKEINTTPAGRFVIMHQFTIRIPMGTVPQTVNRINLKVDISREKPHPNVDALNSTSSDPSIRLGLRVTFQHGYDDGVKSEWLYTTGTQAVYKMNTLVDSIEGRTIEDIENTPRRWLGKNGSRGRDNCVYT